MKKLLKKIFVMLPVVMISLFYLRILYDEQYSNSSSKRILGFVLSVSLFYAWILLLTLRRQQDNFLQAFVQSSFFVYVFAVLQLTGYFILFREVSSHDWWGKMNHRIDTNDHVNFELFATIKRYHLMDKQVVGNAIMLLPLGIFIPLLNRRLRTFGSLFIVSGIAFLVSFGIETLQLATNYRSTDVDDLILNTAGAGVGFLIFQMIKSTIPKE